MVRNNIDYFINFPQKRIKAQSQPDVNLSSKEKETPGRPNANFNLLSNKGTVCSRND
jgi:hypothetical protein